MGERIIITAATGLCGASWAYYFASMSRASTLWWWSWLPVGGLLGALTWWRYSRGHRTEVAEAEQVRPLERFAITIGISVAGLVAGLCAPETMGVKDPSWAVLAALGLSFASVFGWVAWRHPTLFYKNRRF